jgi:hypothetical protein
VSGVCLLGFTGLTPSELPRDIREPRKDAPARICLSGISEWFVLVCEKDLNGANHAWVINPSGDFSVQPIKPTRLQGRSTA